MSPRLLTTLTVLFAVLASTLAFWAAILKHNIERRWDFVPIVGGIVMLTLAASAWSRYRNLTKKK